MADDIVARLREVADSSYGLGVSLTQVRRIAERAAERIEQLERRQQALREAIDAVKQEAANG